MLPDRKPNQFFFHCCPSKNLDFVQKFHKIRRSSGVRHIRQKNILNGKESKKNNILDETHLFVYFTVNQFCFFPNYVGLSKESLIFFRVLQEEFYKSYMLFQVFQHNFKKQTSFHNLQAFQALWSLCIFVILGSILNSQRQFWANKNFPYNPM